MRKFEKEKKVDIVVFSSFSFFLKFVFVSLSKTKVLRFIVIEIVLSLTVNGNKMIYGVKLIHLATRVYCIFVKIKYISLLLLFFFGILTIFG